MADTVFITGVPGDQIEARVKSILDPGAEVEEIPEGSNVFTLKIVFPDPVAPPPPPPTGLNWATAPKMDFASFHTKFPGAQTWAYDERGVMLGDGTRLVSRGKPITCTAILALYGAEILAASKANGVPPELVVMTIATETGSNRRSKFTGPDTFRWEPRITDYSAGPMQTLGSTARSMIDKFRLPHPKPPVISSRPVPPPDDNPLYSGKVSIDIGTAYIKNNLASTGFDPILVAAAYNAGSLRPDPGNPWGLVTFGEHLNRSAEWYGDACALLTALRRGESLDTSTIKPPPSISVPDPAAPNDFALTGLGPEEADEEQEQFELSGATVRRQSESGGTFRLDVRPPAETGGGPPAAAAVDGIPPPDRDGYVICASRRRVDTRSGKIRSVGVYQAFFNRVPIADIKGVTVEPHGPGDNRQSGVNAHSRLEAKYYPLFTHERPNLKYRTLNYSATGDIKRRPWPSIRIEDTGNRSGVLIHCAGGFMMTIGCVNLSTGLAGAGSDIGFGDSRNRVIALIDSMKSRLPNFPNANNRRIEDAWLRVVDDPS